MRIQTKSTGVMSPGTTRAGRKNETIIRPFEVKQIDDAERTFTGLAAAFSLDQGGDVILPGAFKRTLADWKRTKGQRIIYLIDSHNYFSVRNVVGKMIEAAETADGLSTTHQVIDGPDGDEIWRRVKGGFINGLSIGFRTVEQRNASTEEQRQGIFRFLKEVQLKENSLVIWPMNEDARLDAIKSLLSAAKERTLTEEELDELKSIATEIQALLAPSAPAGESAPPPPAPDPVAVDPPVVADPPAAEEGKVTTDGVAPDPVAPVEVTLAADDPRRIKMEAMYRELMLHVLSAR